MNVRVLTLLAALSAFPLIAQNTAPPTLQISKDNRTLSISATDHAEADPDAADINVGFTAYGSTLPSTYKSASDSSNAIVKAMLAAGAPQSGIQSRTQSVYPLQVYDIKSHPGMRFGLNQSWKVTVAPKDAALILDAAIQAGANQSGDINWRLKDNITLDQRAITLATERAHTMAAEMVKTMGVTLGKPIYATNSTSSNMTRPRMMLNSFMAKSAQAAAEPLAIEPQQVESTATVEIVYSIE